MIVDPQIAARLCCLHPNECPTIDGLLPYLIHPPSRVNSTAAWERFRDRTLRPLIK